MKSEFINPFTEAAFYVLSEVLGSKPTRGSLDLRADPHVSRGVASIVGVTGQLRGHVIYDMEKKTAIEIASVMNGEKMFGVDNIVRSTINELANMDNGTGRDSTFEWRLSLRPHPSHLRRRRVIGGLRSQARESSYRSVRNELRKGRPFDISLRSRVGPDKPSSYGRMKNRL
ncbi:MAG: hypothetical protein D6679_14295 [Candidatus Hydrogenedentota bacterium]|nr:MAG: hypothetical protein D6679_14295 [Candidatus Hydrogenedentota bacterium]